MSEINPRHYTIGRLVHLVEDLRGMEEPTIPDEIIDVLLEAQQKLIDMKEPALRRAAATSAGLLDLDEIGDR